MEHKDYIEEAQKALCNRPSISLRMRIGLFFLLFFIINCGITVFTIIFLSNLSRKQNVLEKIGNYYFELQQTRRYEKNYFLYGTGLYEMEEHLQIARNTLSKNQNKVQSVIGKSQFEEMKTNLKRYKLAVDHIIASTKTSSPLDDKILEDIRTYGAKILIDASEILERERIEVHKMIHMFKMAAIFLLFFGLLVAGYIALLIVRMVMKPIGRFVGYAQRIARGDFSPIQPKRKYRDEFSDLAVALNVMISEIEKNQEQIIQSSKMAAIGTLTSGIAHELNNPLNNIGLTTEALIDNFEDYKKEEKLKMLNEISIQVERASATVKNLLDFTREEKSVFIPVSINDIIKSTLKLIQNEIMLKNIVVDLKLEEDIPKMRGNPRNLQQVFINLFLNSIQAITSGGTIGVSTKVKDSIIRIDVYDTGVGIPKDSLGKIFEPFYTTKDVGEGTGLGLSVTYGIVKSHKGEIKVKSKPGETVFSIFFPIEADKI